MTLMICPIDEKLYLLLIFYDVYQDLMIHYETINLHNFEIMFLNKVIYVCYSHYLFVGINHSISD